jgi:hypothetical protein
VVLPTRAPAGTRGELPRLLTRNARGSLIPRRRILLLRNLLLRNLLLCSLLLCIPLPCNLLLLCNRALFRSILVATNAASIWQHRALYCFLLVGREPHNASSASVFSTRQFTRIPGADCQFVKKRARTIRRQREVVKHNNQSSECFKEVLAAHDFDFLVSVQETSNTRYITYSILCQIKETLHLGLATKISR